MKLASHSKKTVLITGIDSFTGIYLSKNLEQSGFCVFGTTTKASSSSRILTCDLTNREQIASVICQVMPDYVIHLAGISFVGHSVTEDFYRINVIGTEYLLDALTAVEDKLKKVVLASSATVYGQQEQSVLNECLCPNPVNHYGISKLNMEYVARNYFQRLPIIIVRPFNYIGSGQPEHFVIPKIVKHYKEKKKIIELGNTNVEREFNSVYFAVEIYQKLLMANAESEVVNLCSGRGITLMDIIDNMNLLAGYQIEVTTNPKFVRPNELAKLVGCPEKLKSIVGPLPQNDLVAVLKEMYEL